VHLGVTGAAAPLLAIGLRPRAGLAHDERTRRRWMLLRFPRDAGGSGLAFAALHEAAALNVWAFVLQQAELSGQLAWASWLLGFCLPLHRPMWLAGDDLMGFLSYLWA